MSDAQGIRAGRAYVSLGADSRELEAKVKKGESLLKHFKQQLGEDSTLGNLGKMAMGAGAVAGLTLAARALKDMTGKAVEFKDALDSGKMTAGQVADELVKSIPILGQIREAGLSIQELFTGQQAAAAAMTAEVAFLNSVMDRQQKIVAAGAQSYEAMLAALQDLKREGGMIGLAGPQREVNEHAIKFADEQRRIQQRAAQERAKLEGQTFDVTIGGKTEKLTPAEGRRRIEDAINKANREKGERQQKLDELGGLHDAFGPRAGLEKGIAQNDQTINNLARQQKAMEDALNEQSQRVGIVAIEQMLESFKNFGARVGETGAAAFDDLLDKIVEHAKVKAAEAADVWEAEVGRMVGSGAMTAADYAAEAGASVVARAEEMAAEMAKSVDAAAGRQGGGASGHSVGTFNPFAAQMLGHGARDGVEANTAEAAKILRRIERNQSHGRGQLTYR